MPNLSARRAVIFAASVFSTYLACATPIDWVAALNPATPEPATPSLAEPKVRVPWRDPVLGTCLVRVTDRARDLAPGDASA